MMHEEVIQKIQRARILINFRFFGSQVFVVLQEDTSAASLEIASKTTGNLKAVK